MATDATDGVVSLVPVAAARGHMLHILHIHDQLHVDHYGFQPAGSP